MAKVTNLALILSLLLSVIPHGSLLAADGQASSPTAECERADTTSNTIFLPIINGGQGAVAALVDAVSAPQDAPRTITWAAGKTYTYDYKVEVTNTGFTRDQTEGTKQSEEPSRTVVEAVAEIAITSVGEDGTAVGQVTLKDTFVCTADGKNGTEAIADDAEFTTALETPIIFEQSAAGVITSVQLPENSNPTVTNVQKGVINALQVTLQTDSNSYTVEEVGGQGTYNAKYELTEEGDNLNIARTYDDAAFSDMKMAGDETNSLSLSTSTSAVLDGGLGILTSVNTEEKIATGDGTDDLVDGSEQGFDGATAWAEISTVVNLTYKSMADTPAIRSAALSAVYVEGSLGAEFNPDESSNPTGIAIDELDLDAEIEALVDEPNNPVVFLRVMDIVRADLSGTTVLDVVKAKLTANAENTDAANALLDVLTQTGTPYAQDILVMFIDSSSSVEAASITARTTITTEEHALISLVLIDSPTMTTVNSIKSASEQAGELQSTAISVLGATVDKIADSDPNTAGSLTNDLLAGLSNAGTEEGIDAYLNALGNAQQPEAVDEISSYLTGTLTLDSGEVLSDTAIYGLQFGAYSALGRIPGQEAENLLIAGLNNDDNPLGTRLTIFDLMSERGDLSSAGLAALQQNSGLGNIGTDGSVSAADANAIDAILSRSWNKSFGNSKLGLALPGKFTVATPPDYYPYAYAQQEVDGYVWNRKFSIADGRLGMWRHNSSQYKYGAYLYLLNYSITRKYENTFSCALSRSGSLWSYNKSLKFNYQIPVAGIITVGVEVRIGATAGLNYGLSVNACNLSNSSASAAVYPYAYATAAADAYVSLAVVRGGVGISAKIADTRFTLSLTGTYNGNARICVDISVRVQALSGNIYAFADRRKYVIFGSWKRFWSGNLASFGTPTRNYDLVVRCWP